jgi:hypothetical protein
MVPNHDPGAACQSKRKRPDRHPLPYWSWPDGGSCATARPLPRAIGGALRFTHHRAAGLADVPER